MKRFYPTHPYQSLCLLDFEKIIQSTCLLVPARGYKIFQSKTFQVSTPSFDPGLLNPTFFNHELFNRECISMGAAGP